jgi:aerobic carbon-monoxide dehydrogenase medium subunit
MAITSESAEVLLPASEQEAVAAFGDGVEVTVIAGGTIVMPEITAGRLRPRRTLLLARAGLDGLRAENGTVTIGATTPVAALESAPEPLGSAARSLADYEVRAQATVGGNICAPPGLESPRGDLQPALIALDARVRSAGAEGERVDPIEEFLAGGEGRLVLGIEFEEPKRGSYAALDRPHTHSYTVLAVACADTAAGVRVAVGGAGPKGARCPSVEHALAGGADAATAALTVTGDVEPQDDALASAWYRKRMLPILVERALNELLKEAG